MCCWPFVDVVLENPPPKKAEEEEEEKKEYLLVSDKLNLVGPAQVAPTYQPVAGPYYAGHPIPEPAHIWLGSTKAQVDAQNAALAKHVGAYEPIQLVPATSAPGQQFYCRELGGAYSLRTTTDIETSCQPGVWHTAKTGYPYFVRTKPA
ncbi:MAG: hypothetical protein Q9218_004673 [Villophora microphyllina]